MARIVPERWPALLGAVAAAATVICGYALLVKVFPGTLNANDLVGRLEGAVRLLERHRPGGRARRAGVHLGRRAAGPTGGSSGR